MAIYVGNKFFFGLFCVRQKINLNTVMLFLFKSVSIIFKPIPEVWRGLPSIYDIFRHVLSRKVPRWPLCRVLRFSRLVSFFQNFKKLFFPRVRGTRIAHFGGWPKKHTWDVKQPISYAPRLRPRAQSMKTGKESFEKTLLEIEWKRRPH